ncbi:MATE family efflux transporter [Methanobrevibacter olleyae]|uniref:Multidrug-efflux transporter n=1 Tax=Methanobrevibacter olleyae TaxID=294671 RepID=A0A126R0A2_METOL|nr:MATE family efflux transporter [Methanobrevibacter olleyae]AMK15498.1 MatE efflux family protein [Methanobrevibacter olleyae]SFL37941.1 putative efflux protein, MATE family [Methanobrevibacter olleyae]
MQTNKNIESIIGDPKKAINRLAYPTILSMLLMFANNLIDSMWVGGLGSGPLAALGFMSPLYLVILGFGVGIGAGANSLISRYIGAKRYRESNNAAMHSIIIAIIISIFLFLIGHLFLKDLLILFGASSVIDYAMDYGFIIFFANIIILSPAVISSLFRAEGDIKRATWPLVLNAVLNLVLDPILIYYFNWGIKGAAIATVLSTSANLFLMLYWYLIKRDTFIKLSLKYYNRKLEIYKEILLVSLPASCEELIYSIVGICFNYLIIITAGTMEVAVFTVVWRFVSIAFLPCISIGIATITVSGVAYGAKNYKNFKTTINYSTFISFIITLIICTVFFVFAYPISESFNFISGNTEMINRTAEVLRIMVFYNLFIPFGATAAYVYQGVGSGFKSLSLTILRELILSISFAYLLAITFKMGIFGLYLGAIIGMILGCFIGFGSILIYERKFKKECLALENSV